MKMHFVIAASLVLTGCVSVGSNFDMAAVDHLTVGMSKEQVIAALGKPTQVVTYSGGTERLVWVHSTGSVLGASASSVGLPFKDGKLTEVPK